MAQQRINVGSGDYSGDGESLRSAFTKTNDNFDEVYTNIADILSTATTDQLVNGPHNFVLGADAKLTLPSTGGYVNTLYTDNGGSRTKLEKKIESSTTTGVIAKLELDLDNEHIRLAIGNYAINDQWIDNTWAFSSNGILTLPNTATITNNVGDITIESNTGFVNLVSGPHTFTFDADTVGRLIMPDYGVIAASNQVGIFVGNTQTEIGKTWIFNSSGNLTLPANNKTTTELVAGVGYSITNVENYNNSYTNNRYRWISVEDINFSTALSTGLSIGWVFYPVGNPSASVTVVQISYDPPSNVDVTFSGPLGVGPYVAHSANYVAEHYSPVVIGFTSTNWTFAGDGTLTLPVGGQIINLEIDGGDSSV